MQQGEIVSEDPVLSHMFTGISTANAIAAVLLVFVIFKLCLLWVYVPSPSMVPTLNLGENCITVCIQKNTPVERGDILCFVPYTEENGYLGTNPKERDTLYIKRCMGLPGDTLKIEGGVLYINGAPQDEPYIANDGPMADFEEVTIPENSYFMMGDNRNYSYDSRIIGYIPRENLRSKVLFHFPSLTGFILNRQ